MFGIAPITKIVIFKIEVNTTHEKKAITFTDIQVAQKSTGVTKNDGFNRTGAWSGAKPVFIYELLNKVSDDIQTCMSKN